MARPSRIDRNDVLDAAEAVVRDRGIAGVTIGGVAQAAGISKGGVQAIFGSKDQLIHAMYERWSGEFDRAVAALAGPTPSPVTALRAHAEATRRTDEAQADRAAALMTGLLTAEAWRAYPAEWYRERFDLADTGTEEGRRARIAFLATEGAFLLRSFGFLNMSDEEWQAIFADVQALLCNAEARPER
ncbi:TetR/AcrR family transcriptional regulator [Chitinasiproducens palmae]|uniref:DNA-binding transcriptional regulator, AcrR family n=1 Tax=Chitinasiproducens palmae TaxID=1770053 RepID=A0A1H2PKF5_9BURK|nr:TetR/AcrR family transcriptional regulator [Chitinasiproducens palmae]SDV46038.1 DNA-binding transcriptional regulator, AcrR family [Chitinasiproducens palmae]